VLEEPKGGANDDKARAPSTKERSVAEAEEFQDEMESVPASPKDQASSENAAEQEEEANEPQTETSESALMVEDPPTHRPVTRSSDCHRAEVGESKRTKRRVAEKPRKSKVSRQRESKRKSKRKQTSTMAAPSAEVQEKRRKTLR
jgi:hypothetical protein